MMKKRNLIIIGLLTFLLIPYKASAVNMTININCSQVTVGQTTTCSITGTSDGEVTGVEGNFSISGGASIVSAARDSGWGNGDYSASGFSLYTDVNKEKTFAIGTVTIKGNTVGSATLSVTGVKAVGSDFNEYPSGNKSRTISVVAPTTTTTTTKKPTTTTTIPISPTTKKPTTTLPIQTTTKKPITAIDPAVPTTTPNITNPSGSDITSPDVTMPTAPLIKLTSVTVDEFEVKYENGKYYVTVNYDTESVNVSATAEEGITIIGTGKRTLTQGKNVVELVLRNTYNQSAIAQVVITRPEDTNEYDTTLRLIKVVDYDLKFDRDKKEYTLIVPSSVKELYFIAESDNVDVIITGAGLQTLKKGKNDIYIRASYGDLATTEYVIHVKRSYLSVFMWIAIGLLGAGLIGTYAYYFLIKRKTSDANLAEKNRIIAERNRAMAASQNTISVNGQNVLGIGRNTVVPTKVVDIKQPTNPVAAATVQPKEVKPVQMSSSSPQPQVRVIKRTVVPQPAMSAQPSKNYNDDDIVITDIN